MLVQKAVAQLTILHNFGDGSVPNDGENPPVGLTEAPNSIVPLLYYKGALVGVLQGPRKRKNGEVFAVTGYPDGPWSLQSWHIFSGYPSDGNFYDGAGAGSFPDEIFKMVPGGKATTFYTFPGNQFMTGPLIQGADGNLYGLTGIGGSTGKGTVFQLSTDASSFNVLHNFNDGSVPNDGQTPIGVLTVGADNNLHGTTDYGGSAGLVTVFKISP